MVRILFALILVLLPAVLDAAPRLSERSPVRVGLWFDPQHAGSGFDIHAAPGQLFVVWYTYRSDGTAIWYTAQGAVDAAGRFDATLLEHRWTGGAHGGYRAAGRLVLERTHPHALSAQWSLDGASGTWALVPLPLSGAGPEIDHTGAWYDRARAGYGLTVTEQGEWLAAAYYVYDADGAPTWLFGTNAGRGSALTLTRFRGSCPACPYASAEPAGDVRAQVAFEAETRLSLSIDDGARLLAPAWRRFAQPLALLTTPAAARAADRQLAGFDDAAALEAYVEAALIHPPYYAINTVDFSPPPMTEFSTTNLVESGVDESDVVKTDGTYVYTFDAEESGRRLPSVRVARVRDGGPDVDVVGRFDTAAARETTALVEHRMYLDGTRLVTLSTATPHGYLFGPSSAGGFTDWQGGRTDVEIFDRADPVAPASRWHGRFEGYLVTSRRVGDDLVLVLRSAPVVPGYRYGTSERTVAENTALLATVPLAQLVPRMSAGPASTPLAPYVDPTNVFVPPAGSRVPSPEYATIVRIPLDAPGAAEALAIVGGVESVYASPTDLYVATTRYEPQYALGVGYLWPGFSGTDVHQIALAGGLRVVASGSVDGVVGRDVERAPFRFSAANGRLRLVTVGDFGALGHNRVTILEPSQRASGVLRTVGTLPNLDRPEPIGKPYEQLYGTRFVGDRLYAVTYLSTDPLYVIDLSRPDDPYVAGAVELTGYSEYLHPLPGDLLLGVGKDASPAETRGDDARFAWYQGLKVALFDVRDPNAPRVVATRLIGQRGTQSAVLYDHHAFSALRIDAGRVRVAFPVRVHGTPFPSRPDSGNYQYAYTHSGLYTLDVVGGAGDGALVPLPPLVTYTAADGYGDDAVRLARSVLLPTGAIYLDRGRYFTARWDALADPVGPK